MTKEIKFEQVGQLNTLDSFTISADSPLALALKDNFDAQKQLLELIQEVLSKKTNK